MSLISDDAKDPLERDVEYDKVMNDLPEIEMDKEKEHKKKRRNSDGEREGYNCKELKISECGFKEAREIGGLFQMLPPELLKNIMRYLPLMEIKKIRRLSSWFEERVTRILHSVFGTYNIKNILGLSCAGIMETLSKAMSKPLNVNNKLRLKFEGEMDKYLIKLLILNNYKKNIISLHLQLYGSEQILLEPSLKFDGLETLCIKARKEAHREIIETMLSKHANTLKNFILVDRFEIIDDLTITALPNLKSVKLVYLSNKAAFSVLKACKQIVTSLELHAHSYGTSRSMRIPDASNFQLPSLRHLTFDVAYFSLHYWNYLIYNANHLESLSLGWSSIPLKRQIPDLPKLKELKIRSGCGRILTKCKNSLQYLEASVFPDEFSFEMPQLTTLFLSDSPGDCSKLLSLNHKNLEFLHLPC